MCKICTYHFCVRAGYSLLHFAIRVSHSALGNRIFKVIRASRFSAASEADNNPYSTKLSNR